MSEDQQSPGADEPAAAADPGREWNLPWAEPFQATDPERAELAADFAGAIRKTGSLTRPMGAAAADRIGRNATDLNCLHALSSKSQLTGSGMGRESGLTTASITGVVDRLEQAGYL